MTHAESGADRGLLDDVSRAMTTPEVHTTTTTTAAPVAPVPRTEDFHVGQILSGGHADPAKATGESEESYIPVALARAHLARVVLDMHTMKHEQTAKMTQIVDRYKTIEAETKAYYESYITELKRTAKAKFRVEQTKFSALKAEYCETQQLAREEIYGLSMLNDQHQRRHEQQKAAWREDVETAFVRYEEELTRLHARVESDIGAALQRQAQTLSGAHTAEIERLQQSWDDARAESVSVVEQTKQQLRQQLTETEASYETQIRTITRDADVALESFKCLSTVVNCVVDMHAQTKRRKRSRELQGEIAALGKQVEISTATERALATQLSRLTAQYDATEQRAVRQTMDVLLRAVELVPLDQKEPVPPYQDPAPSGQRPVSLRPLAVEREAQTTDWAALLAAHSSVVPVVEAPPHKPPVETRDVAVETAAHELEAPKPTKLPTLQFPTATQLQYEADAERFRERNAELLQSKATLQTLKADLQACLDRKNDAKARIKQWLADFQQQHAREPTIAEKAQVKDLYLAFKGTEEASNAAKARVTDAKAQHHERVVEIEALSQWHALAASASARGSSRGGSDSDTVSGRPRPALSSSMLLQTTQDGAPLSATEPTSAKAKLEEVDKLAKQVDALRAELHVAQAEKTQAHDDAQRAVLDAQHAQADAQADAKATADKLALAEATALEGVAATPPLSSVDQPPAKAEEQETATKGKEQADERTKREAEERRKHHERLEAYAHEAQVLDAQRTELQASIASLRDEIAMRASEKQALETQIEQLKLHVELMDDGHDDGATMRAADAKEDDDEEQDEGEQEEADTLSSPLPSSLSEADRIDGATEAQLITHIKDAIEAGKAQWNRGDKAKCFQLYVQMGNTCVDVLRATAPPGRREDVAALKAALQEAGRLPPAKGSMVLRRQLDNCLAACEARAKQRAATEEAETTAMTAMAKMGTTTTPSSSPQRKTPHKKSVAPFLMGEDDKPRATTPSAGTSKALEESKHKLKALETKVKADKVRITQLEAAVAKAETQLVNVSSSSGTSGGGASTAVLERKLAEAEKKHAKALDEAEKTLKRELAALTQQLSGSHAKSQTLQEQVDKLTQELSVAGGKATQLSKMEDEVAVLRTKAAQVDALGQELTTSQHELAKLEVSYKEEQALRKKYYNTIEDMKGKIRVYARCRPMSASESERGCATCVRFVDECSLELKTSHGPKPFAYDQVFTPASSQDQVFEDTKNLLQSALDGYNVCIFAYGQTGSGKTFTMTGSDALPGLSPRAIHHLFKLADEHHANHTITFQAFMLELYNDNLIDLFHLVDGGGHDHTTPKLDIKKNDKGMVYVSNITTKSCTSAHQTLKLFDAANKKRQVGATKMNAESSRSHSVFSLLIENYNKTTKTTSIGKLSLVDLAGSERAGKTGATNDRLKEAQAINKSLSALGDVIAALSSGEKFIPYRNNKLTQLMQDSLGGNAKTLMFVNISPADYNQEETQTSLQYASRVKLITNSANKTSESETVNRLKHIIKQLRAGKSDVELDGTGIDY